MRKYDPAETRARIAAWCDRRERCAAEVVQKLQDWGVEAEERRVLVNQLTQSGALDEVRYAKAFAHDHFILKHWGWRKINAALMAKGLSEPARAAAEKGLSGAEVAQKLVALLAKKQQQLSHATELERKQKLYRYACGKGYSSAQVWEAIGALDRST